MRAFKITIGATLLLMAALFLYKATALALGGIEAQVVWIGACFLTGIIYFGVKLLYTPEVPE